MQCRACAYENEAASRFCVACGVSLATVCARCGTENSDQARMERFLLRAREMVPLEELYVVPVADGGQYRLWVLFGDFASREDALAAGKRLPPRYQESFRPAPRSFGELRRQL